MQDSVFDIPLEHVALVISPKRPDPMVIPRRLHVRAPSSIGTAIIRLDYHGDVVGEPRPSQFLESTSGRTDWACELDATSGLLRRLEFGVPPIVRGQTPAEIIDHLIRGDAWRQARQCYRGSSRRIPGMHAELHSLCIEATAALIATGRIEPRACPVPHNAPDPSLRTAAE